MLYFIAPGPPKIEICFSIFWNMLKFLFDLKVVNAQNIWKRFYPTEAKFYTSHPQSLGISVKQSIV